MLTSKGEPMLAINISKLQLSFLLLTFTFHIATNLDLPTKYVKVARAEILHYSFIFA